PDLPHEDLAGYAAPLLPLLGRRRAHVVVGDDRLHLDPVLGGQLHGHLHVHVVAGIVAVEADNAAPAIDGPDGVVEALGGRRGEQFAYGDGVHEIPTGVAD